MKLRTLPFDWIWKLWIAMFIYSCHLTIITLAFTPLGTLWRMFCITCSIFIPLLAVIGFIVGYDELLETARRIQLQDAQEIGEETT